MLPLAGQQADLLYFWEHILQDVKAPDFIHFLPASPSFSLRLPCPRCHQPSLLS